MARIGFYGGTFNPIHLGHVGVSRQAVKQLRASYAVYRPIVYICSPYAGEIEKKVGYVMWPIRTAVSGKQSTPGGATEIMEILGKEESVKRIKDGIELLSK